MHDFLPTLIHQRIKVGRDSAAKKAGGRHRYSNRGRRLVHKSPELANRRFGAYISRSSLQISVSVRFMSCTSPPNLQIVVSVHPQVHRNDKRRGALVHKPVELACTRAQVPRVRKREPAPCERYSNRTETPMTRKQSTGVRFHITSAMIPCSDTRKHSEWSFNQVPLFTCSFMFDHSFDKLTA